MDEPRQIDLGFTTEHLPQTAHICLVFDTDDEREEIVSAYLAAGIRRGEAARYASDGTTPEGVRSWLKRQGLEAQPGGPPLVMDAADFYCPAGRFDPLDTIGRMQRRYDSDIASGYPASRVSAEMSWVFRGLPGSERLLEYEALINTITHPFPHSGMCQYDARRFDGATLFKVLQVHPYMIAHGRVVRNPYFVRPDELAARRT